jgi:hypothetical protein
MDWQVEAADVQIARQAVAVPAVPIVALCHLSIPSVAILA